MIIQEDIRIGNYFLGFDNKPFKWELEHFTMVGSSSIDFDEIIKEPIPLTEEWLLNFGFINGEHLIFETYFKKDLSRGRRLIITDIGTPNFMVMIAHGSLSQVGRQDDVITLHNWDYDKDMYVHQLQNLFKVIKGEELEVSL